MIDRDELAAWLRLVGTAGMGRDGARRALAAFGSPEAVLAASHKARASALGNAFATALDAPPDGFDSLLAATSAWLAGGVARDVLVLGDPRYPDLLLQTADPPTLLYVDGRTELLRAPSVAVVGSRNPTPQGLDNARAFAETLSGAGLTVVSGLALGVDGAAHDGALRGIAAGAPAESPGSTIAVVGTGLDTVYPARHRALAKRIVEHGLIVSEFPIGTSSRAENFPIRNRIIAGLARGTLVVEAAVQSGSLITARLALEAGRDVFAIPGSIHSPLSRGCHLLLKQGAKLVDAASDILEEFALPSRASNGSVATGDGSPLSKADGRLLEAIGYDPIDLDGLVARTGFGAAELSARLLDLELDGRIARLPGQRFQRVVRG